MCHLTQARWHFISNINVVSLGTCQVTLSNEVTYFVTWHLSVGNMRSGQTDVTWHPRGDNFPTDAQGIFGLWRGLFRVAPPPPPIWRWHIPLNTPLLPLPRQCHQMREGRRSEQTLTVLWRRLHRNLCLWQKSWPAISVKIYPFPCQAPSKRSVCHCNPLFHENQIN
jgi:hypothetical protein